MPQPTKEVMVIVPTQPQLRKRIRATSSSPSATPLDDALGFLFRRLSGYADSVFLAVTEQTQLTPMQMGVLLTLNEFEHLSVRELARRMHVDRSTMQELFKRMETKGLIRSRTAKSDRRTYELWLTSRGRALLKRYAPFAAIAQERLLKGFNPDDRKRLILDLKNILSQSSY
jgi:DNA-binding MarR family transcriptional regulator